MARPENDEFLAFRTIDLTGEVDGHLEAVVFGPSSENRQLPDFEGRAGCGRVANSVCVLKVIVGLSWFAPKQNRGRVRLKIREVPYVFSLMPMSHRRIGGRSDRYAHTRCDGR